MKFENAAVWTSAREDRGPAGSSLQINFGYASKACGKARSEDFYGIMSGRRDSGTVVAIADGVQSVVGGGRLAAESVVRSLFSDYHAAAESWGAPYALDKILGSVNSWLFAEHRRRPELGGLITTLSAIVLRGNRYYLAHVGDTRIYRQRDQSCEQLTTDHVWPHRDMDHLLNRAIGLDEHVVIEYKDGELHAGDVFLLVSDGVWEVIGEKPIRDTMEHCSDPQRAADELVNKAVARQRMYMGRNDATAVVARIDACPV